MPFSTCGVQANTRPLCRPVSDYLPALAEMRDRYGVREVYLATDEETVVHQMHAAAPGLGMNVRSLAIDRSVFRSDWFIEHRIEAGAADPWIIADTALVDLLLLSECDYLVVTLSSQMGRLALALSAARTGIMPPFWSIDGMAWGCCAWAGENLQGVDPAAFYAATALRPDELPSR